MSSRMIITREWIGLKYAFFSKSKHGQASGLFLATFFHFFCIEQLPKPVIYPFVKIDIYFHLYSSYWCYRNVLNHIILHLIYYECSWKENVFVSSASWKMCCSFQRLKECLDIYYDWLLLSFILKGFFQIQVNLKYRVTGPRLFVLSTKPAPEVYLQP